MVTSPVRGANRGPNKGPISGTDRRHSLLCVLSRKCRACRSSLEWRRQLWWGCGFPLRGSHCAADSGHLSQILWSEGQCFLAFHLLVSMALAALAVEFIF